MAVHAIPTFEDPFYSMTIALEGKPYVFDFRYNQREQLWHLSISLEDGTALATGIKIVCGVNLLGRYADIRLPPGLLTAIANGDEPAPPSLLELGEDKRVTLTYFTSDEIQ